METCYSMYSRVLRYLLRKLTSSEVRRYVFRTLGGEYRKMIASVMYSTPSSMETYRKLSFLYHGAHSCLNTLQGKGNLGNIFLKASILQCLSIDIEISEHSRYLRCATSSLLDRDSFNFCLSNRVIENENVIVFIVLRPIDP